jgi:glyoxylase-like metal-dependent hydrolase (beta-lactamase superfamily II)
MSIPTAARWFSSSRPAPHISRYEEPFVDEMVQANFWRVEGRDHDLVIDCGLGVGSLRRELPELFAHNPIVVLTHGHLDHMGGAHEFSGVLAHPADPISDPPPGSLHGPELSAELGLDQELPPLLISALPDERYDPDSYRLRPPRAIADLHDGDTIDLGDRAYTVLHLPGHSPGQLALYDEHSRELFSGDVIYDGQLLDRIHGADPALYRESLKRLRGFAISRVYPGHGDPFGQQRLRELIDDYINARPTSERERQ